MKRNINLNKLLPGEKRYSVSLGDGLTVRVMPSGVISWVVRIPAHGKVKDITLGHYPEISRKQAVQLARRERKKYSLKPPTGYTFRDAFTLWSSLKRGSIVSYKGEGEKMRIEKYLLKPLGSMQIDEITPPIIIDIIKELDKENKRATLKRCLMRVNEIFNLAVCAGFIQYNPMGGVSKLFKPPVVEPRKSIDYRQLGELLDKAESFPMKPKLLFLFSLATLLRPGEVVKLRWAWIEGATLTIPAEEMKNRKEFRVPLSSTALGLLRIIKEVSPHKRSAYLFTGVRSNRRLCSQYLTNFLRSIESFKGFLVPHGIRAIGRTWMADEGVAFEVAEACLSHTSGTKVSRAYQRSDYLEARRDVMERWSRYILSCAPCADEVFVKLRESGV